MTIIKSLNGELVEMTAEEETKFLQDQEEAQTQIAERQAAEVTAKTEKATAQASGELVSDFGGAICSGQFLDI